MSTHYGAVLLGIEVGPENLVRQPRLHGSAFRQNSTPTLGASSPQKIGNALNDLVGASRRFANGAGGLAL